LTKVKVGISRFYNANACSVIGSQEIGLEIKFEGFDLHVHAGRSLKHLVMTWKTSPPIPKDDTQPKNPSRSTGRQFPSSELFPADFYLELIVTQWLEIEDELAKAFYMNDIQARDEIYKLMDQKKEIHARALDYVAGFLGLRLNKLLVSTLIQEQEYIYHDNKPSYAIRSNLKVIVTDSYEWDPEGEWRTDIKKVVPQHLTKGKWDKPAGVMVWLLRAWAAKDIVLKFVSLLTALESVIPGLPATEINNWVAKKNTILTLIKKYGPGPDLENLASLVEDLKPPSPIVSRFEFWASKKKLTGWKNDIITFKRFNRMRNLLFHRGQPGVEYQVDIELKDIQALEDIAERYVSLALFGDANVYKSKRPKKEDMD
jgi:hypothetical protein